MHRHFLKPRALIAIGLLLLGATAAEVRFLRSKGHHATVNSRASEQFGEALERAGIQTQASPSK
ncbi:MAG: hypothetical protein ORN23_09700 [Chthoniobacterales bacterium]|nr:hypothetical protein [Chthoniobacterales bacterium]